LSLLAAIDVGGTKTLVELFDARSEDAGRDIEFPTPGSGDVVGALVRAVDDLRGKEAVDALAVGCPGPLEPRAGLLLDPPNLAREWWHLPLGRRLAEAFSCPVAVENDANLGALGEAVGGAGKGFRSVLYITVSTGVGGGFVRDGAIFRGGRGFGLELGHTTVGTRTPALCSCGREGCLEAVASGSAIAARAREAGFDREDAPSARAVAAAAVRGDGLARQVLEEAAAYLAEGIVNFMYVVDPSLVLIGGGVSQSDLFVDLVAQAVASEKVMDPFRDVPVRRAELGRRSVIRGARALAADVVSEGVGRDG
jgi:glucokinase